MTAQTMARFALVAVLAACGGDNSGPSDTDGDGGGNGPPPEADVATVVVVDGNLAQGSGQQTVRLHLRNDGPAGTYRLQFWESRRRRAARTPLGDTEPVDVGADFDAEVSVNLIPAPDASFVVVFTRDDAPHQIPADRPLRFLTVSGLRVATAELMATSTLPVTVTFTGSAFVPRGTRRGACLELLLSISRTPLWRALGEPIYSRQTCLARSDAKLGGRAVPARDPGRRPAASPAHPPAVRLRPGRRPGVPCHAVHPGRLTMGRRHAASHAVDDPGSRLRGVSLFTGLTPARSAQTREAHT